MLSIFESSAHAPLYSVHVISIWPHFLLANSDGFCQLETKFPRSFKAAKQRQKLF